MGDLKGVFLSILVLILASCSDGANDAKKNSSVLKTIEKEDVAPVRFPEIPRDGDLFLIDTSKSVVNWGCLFHIGDVKFSRGYLHFLNEKLDFSVVHTNMKSLRNIDVESDLLRGTLENVLKSPDFFNIEQFPEAHFELLSADPIDENYYNFKGNLILFDIKGNVNFKGSLIFKGDSLYLETSNITIDRTKWNNFYLSERNPNPKEEENTMVVPDTIGLQVKIVAYHK